MLEHKSARRDYEIIDRLEAGIELLGAEVKSLRSGRGILTGSRVIVRGEEVFAVGIQIPPYQAANSPTDFDASRTRRLLLTKREIATLAGLESRKGFTLIPLSIYTKGKKLKLELGVVKGKKKYDKREDIKKREDQRAMQRALKRHVRS